MSFIEVLKRKWASRSSESLIKYYKSRGIRIGSNCVFRSPMSTQIDLMRPSLICIGDNVDMNKNFTIMSHDFGHRVFLYKYGDFLSSSGPVHVGSNIYFGVNVTVLKGVTIGDNCIIGAGSVVTKDIPSNSVAAGVPCKVLCSLDEYYIRRKQEWVDEAISYARTIRDVENREPTIDDFRPEFGLYVDSSNINDYDIMPIKIRLNKQYDYWLKNHVANYHGFDDFISHTK